VGVLQRFERRLEGLVEGAFARVFKGPVEPVEVAKRLQREAGDRKAILGPGRTLVPNSYVVELGPRDYSRLSPYEGPLTDELAAMVREYVGEQGWTTFGEVAVALERSDDLDTGIFRIRSAVDADAPASRAAASYQGRQASAGSVAYRASGEEQPAADEDGLDDLFDLPPDDEDAVLSPAGSRPGSHDAADPDLTRASVEARPERPPPRLVIDGSGREQVLPEGDTVIGRAQGAEIRLADTGVSRRHAEIHVEHGYATVTDLGSTNGTFVNGRRVDQRNLEHGDAIRVGSTLLVFRQDS